MLYHEVSESTRSMPLLQTSQDLPSSKEPGAKGKAKAAGYLTQERKLQQGCRKHVSET